MFPGVGCLDATGLVDMGARDYLASTPIRFTLLLIEMPSEGTPPDVMVSSRFQVCRCKSPQTC